MTDNTPDKPESTGVTLSRDLRLFDITLIGVGAMIGAGIFVLTGIAAGVAGPALILSFALNGIVTIFTAMVYAELGSAIPEAGGGYLWVREGLPGPNSFLAGWMSWFAHAVAGSLYALGFGAYVSLVFSEFNVSVFGMEGEIVHKSLAVLVILAFLLINFRGASETGMAGNIVTILKVIVLLVFVGAGLWTIFEHPLYLNKFQNFTPKGFTGILTAMGLTFIAFEGYEIIAQSGEEVKSPRKNIPRAVFLSLAIVVPIYMLVAFVSIGAVTPDTNIPTFEWLGIHAELGIAEAARQFMPFGTVLLLIGGILSTMSALNATTYSSTRVSFAMGRDKNLPDAFAHIHQRRRTPHKALLFSGALIIFMAVVIPIEDVAAAADIMFLLLFLQVNIAVIVIRRKYGDRLKYGYLMPFFPIVPIIGIITKLFLAVFMFDYSPIAWYFSIAWIGAGSVIYYWYAKPRSYKKKQSRIAVREEAIHETDEPRFKILVPLANPASLPILLPPAITAAREHGGLIILLHVIVVPDQLPVSAGGRYVDKSRDLIKEAVRTIEGQGIPANVLIRVSHRAAQAIAETVIEHDVSLLIMGWRGRSKVRQTAVGSNIDRILTEVSCDTLIVQQNGTPPFQRILVPVADPAQTVPALHKARLLTMDKKAEVVVLHVFRRGVDESVRTRVQTELQREIDAFVEQSGAEKLTIELRLTESGDSVKSIVQAADEFACVVLGATRDSWLKRKFFTSKMSRIARRIYPPLALVRSKPAGLKFGIYRILNYLRGGYAEVDLSSEKELRDQGLLLAKSGKRTDLHTSVNKLSLLVSGAVMITSAVTMLLGHGGAWTWIGTAGFLGGLGIFTWVSVRGVMTNSSPRQVSAGKHED